VLLTRSAYFGLAQSQFTLARIYTSELTDRTDLERAYAWLLLCNDKNAPSCKDALAKLKPGLNADQIARSRRLADEYRQVIEQKF